MLIKPILILLVVLSTLSLPSLLLANPLLTKDSPQNTQPVKDDIPLIRNFQTLSKALALNKQLLILEFSAEECPFCEVLENSFLRPMLTDPRYRDKVTIRKVNTDLDNNIIDYNGDIISPETLVDRYDGRLTPTMVFLNHEGEQVGLKIIGINSLDFFGAYLDEEIERGLVAIRGKQDKPHLIN